MANRSATMSMYQVLLFRTIDFTGSRTYSCSADIFRTCDPLTMIQMPAIPAAEGTSCRRREEVPIRKTGVNESIGMDRDRSENSMARKMREKPMMF
jgi:hypothetical protein